MKGDEADDVFLLDDLSPAAFRDQDADSEATRRLLYVAATRARDNVAVVETRTGKGWDDL